MVTGDTVSVGLFNITNILYNNFIPNVQQSRKAVAYFDCQYSTNNCRVKRSEILIKADSNAIVQIY